MGPDYIETGRHCKPKMPIEKRTCYKIAQLKMKYIFFVDCLLYDEQRVKYKLIETVIFLYMRNVGDMTGSTQEWDRREAAEATAQMSLAQMFINSIDHFNDNVQYILMILVRCWCR